MSGNEPSKPEEDAVAGAAETEQTVGEQDVPESRDAARDAEAPGPDGPADRDAEALRVRADEAEARAKEAEAKATEYLERMRRLQAEFDNFRKRMQRDAEEARERANEDLLRSFLEVADSFDRALAQPGDRDGLLDGLKLIHKQFHHVLALHGLERMEAVGKPFDPNLHEALLRQPSDDHAEDVVAQEFEAGYSHRGRVLRAARVAVSTGPAAGNGTETA